MPELDLQQKAACIKLVAMDVDGVLTPGDITYTSAGDEIKSFNVKDGLGMSKAVRAGLILAIITARTSSMVERRAKELDVHHLYQLTKTKLPALQELMALHNLTADEVAYVGDDLPDIPVLEAVGLPCCPADAVREVKAVCAFVSEHKGGRGAMREILDYILAAKG